MNTAKFPYPFPTTANRWKNKIEWLRENIGILGEDWDFHEARFWFKTEQERLLFVLRWP